MNDDKPNGGKNEKNGASGLALGMGMGAAIGTALGSAANNMGLWLPMGISLGLCLGLIYDRRAKNDGSEEPPEDEETGREADDEN